MPVSVAVPSEISGPNYPDLSWIREKIPIQDVARELGLRIIRNGTHCWRTENHANADRDPSVRFYVRKNRWCCFVCDESGSNIDLVMGILECDLDAAVVWICKHFPVPERRLGPGRPKGSKASWQPSCRVGVSGSEFEALARSGMWGEMSPTEKAVLPVLHAFRDPDTGLTTISYRALMRYAGVGSRKSIARAVWHLQRLHALQVSRSPRVGIVRRCSAYRLTLDDSQFIERCNQVCRRVRQQANEERDLQAQRRDEREKVACERVFSSFHSLSESGTRSCKGLNLSSLREPMSNFAAHLVNREIGKTHERGHDQGHQASAPNDRAELERLRLEAEILGRKERARQAEELRRELNAGRGPEMKS